MAVRQIVEILEERCDGCGDCVPSCQEGAIRIVNGKAKLAADALCDGLGACLGHCPKGAIRIVEREADDFVMPPHLVGQPHRGAHAAGGAGGAAPAPPR
ncbi:MAG: 4Fe-4S binding protein, partial [Acidobacteria bacterium]|nr:4Fe-4S binding protein [Acidobacteriota bacterium]